MSEIAILGPGGVGGLLAAALSRAGEPVIVVAREATVDAITRDGITVQSVRLGSFTARPAAVAELRAETEALLVTTKATTLESALDRIQALPRLVVPLLNGLDHLALLRDRFGAGRVAAGVIRVESNSPAPGQVSQTSPFLRVDLAAGDPGQRPGLDRLAARLEHAGVPARVQAGEAQVMWSKLVRLVALACTTSASGRSVGFIRSDPEWRQILAAAIGEAATVANADGGDVDPAATLAELDDAHPELGSSMQRDIAAGRAPELDAIAGAVLRAGRRYGIECPTIERLSLRIAERAGLTQPRVRSGGGGGAYPREDQA